MIEQHRQVRANGISIHLVEIGKGPVVLLCHGFPESWYSWRQQMRALAEAGYRVIAPDMRGYGRTQKPEAVEHYTIFHLTGDMIGLLDALDIKEAGIVGHDWGAPVAWQCALFRPDRFKAVAGLSVPFFPITAKQPSLGWPQTQEAIFYQTYFQTPGLAEAEFAADVEATFRKLAWLWSADADETSAAASIMVPRQGGWLDGITPPARLPTWLNQDDIDFYVGEFSANGFGAPLNWYRNIDLNWQLMAAWKGAKITVPALYMAGEKDLLLKFPGMDRLLEALPRFMPKLEDKIILADCGHWIQREKPDAVNAALLDFLKRFQ